MHTRREQTSGFTMAELLIVVAIVGVLVAIAIPVFTSQLAAAQEATCLANRTSAAHALTVAYITDGDKIDAKTVLKDAIGVEAATSDNGVTVTVEAGGGICPDGGVVTITRNTNGTYTATCSKHGEEDGDGIDTQLYNNLIDIFGENSTYREIADKFGLNGTTDSVVREYYASKSGFDSWTPVKGKNGNNDDTTYYLQFKSYNNNTSGLFLYASSNSDPTKNDWNAKYICDSTGLLGEDSKGQWYELPSTVDQWGHEKLPGIAANSPDGIRAVIQTGTKVNLINGQFVAV